MADVTVQEDSVEGFSRPLDHYLGPGEHSRNM